MPLIPPFIPRIINLTFYQKNKDKNVNKKKHLRGHTFDLAILFTGFQTVRHDSVFEPFHLVVMYWQLVFETSFGKANLDVLLFDLKPYGDIESSMLDRL